MVRVRGARCWNSSYFRIRIANWLFPIVADATFCPKTDGGKWCVLHGNAHFIALFLRQVEQCLGVHVRSAVVTVPAKYGRQQRKALEEACRMAHLEVLALVKAPSAAAIAFSLTNPRETPREILVLDFGACYCDFCLLTLRGKSLYERAVGSEIIDLDSLLVKFCLTDIKIRLGVDMSNDWVAVLRLSMACENAKRKLSQWNQTRVNVEALVQGNDYCVAMSRSYFEEFCSRDIDCLLEIFDICLEESGLERRS